MTIIATPLPSRSVALLPQLPDAVPEAIPQ